MLMAIIAVVGDLALQTNLLYLDAASLQKVWLTPSCLGLA